MNKNFKLALEGLNCAHCAEKIEEKVKNFEKIEDAYLNFMNKEISVTLKNSADKKIVIDKIIDTVNSIESGVKVFEKVQNKFVLKLEGLNCAHCAKKIEEKVENFEKIEDAYLNFMNKEISITIGNSNYKKEVIKEIIEIVNSIESGVIVTEKNINNDEITKNNTFFTSVTFFVIRFLIGAGVFTGAIIFSEKSYLSVGLFIVAYLILGYDVIFKALKNIVKGQVFDENFLMFIATFGAFFINEYTEAVAVMLFYQIGEFFQDMAVEKSRKSIKNLMNIMPEEANVIINGNIKTIKPEDVEINDIVIVKAGEKIPVDGTIISGNSYVDMSALIGESLPKPVFEGMEVLSGAINQSGVLKIKALKKYESSTVSKILNLVENAGSKKSKTENFITKFAKIYTPAVVLSALFIAIIPTLFFGTEQFYQWLERALVFLVSSCPCALIVSIPLGFFSGIGYASKNGVLIKGSNYLQVLKDVSTIVFDKTGTITKGEFVVDKFTTSIKEKDFLKIVYSVERLSNHPVAKAIVSEYEKDFSKDFFEIYDFEEIGGFGISGKINDKEVLVGNYKLMEKYQIKISEKFFGDTNVFVAYDNKFIGEISVCDSIKEDSFSAISKLKNLGIKTIMITGDKKETAIEVSKKLGIEKVYADMLPQDKVSKLEEIISKNTTGKVAFVGDGINDAPVLAMADVGIAMGGVGSDAAIEASDIVIMNDELSKLDTAIKISRNTIKIIKQNIWFVLLVKFIVLALAVFGFASMWLAVFADVGVAVLAIINAMRR